MTTVARSSGVGGLLPRLARARPELGRPHLSPDSSTLSRSAARPAPWTRLHMHAGPRPCLHLSRTTRCTAAARRSASALLGHTRVAANLKQPGHGRACRRQMAAEQDLTPRTTFGMHDTMARRSHHDPLHLCVRVTTAGSAAAGAERQSWYGPAYAHARWLSQRCT